MVTDQPLPGFTALTFNPAHCRADIDAFERLLIENPEISEREQILPFFRVHPHLSLLMGVYNSNVVSPDRLAYELSLFGQFTVDIMAGDWRRKRYCLVEFEDGKRNSIFARCGRQQTTEWTSRYDTFSRRRWMLGDILASVTRIPRWRGRLPHRAREG